MIYLSFIPLLFAAKNAPLIDLKETASEGLVYVIHVSIRVAALWKILTSVFIALPFPKIIRVVPDKLHSLFLNFVASFILHQYVYLHVV